MSKYELIRQTFLGNPQDRIPISIWKHHPQIDRIPDGLANAEIAFHKKFDHDLLKISFFGHYPCIDFGCQAEYDGAVSGSTTLTEAPVTKTSDWETLEQPDVNSGVFGKQIKAVELISEYAQGRVPTMGTIFDGPMVADKICGKNLNMYMTEEPEIMHDVLEMITDTMVEFSKAVLDAGADGLFIASQHSTEAAVSDEHYKEFILPNDAELISRTRGEARYIVMHLHARDKGEKIRFKKITKTRGLDAINWEDQTSSHSLSDGKKLFRKGVIGGIDHNGIFREGTAEAAEQQVLSAIEAAGTRRLVVGPGCVITTDTPEQNIRAVVDAVRSLKPYEEEQE